MRRPFEEPEAAGDTIIMTMQAWKERTALREGIAALRAQGASIGFVPTMGALHEGHLALLRAAKGRGDAVVASVFVNPLQFGPQEDFARYPRMEEADLALLEAEGAAGVYMPEAADMYPPGFQTRVQTGALGERLCGAARPGHFDGMATVVLKLLSRVAPERAYFGEKDYQQLCIIRRMVQDFDLPAEIVGVATMREADGLALSSRNRYLSADERRIAAALPAVLRETARQIAAGQAVAAALSTAEARLLQKGFAQVDYVALCRERTLEPLSAPEPGCRLLAAARIGRTRLIDNIDLNREAT